MGHYDNRDSIRLGSEPIAKLFKEIFFPTLLGMVFTVAFILTDGVFVGHGVGPEGLASINLVSPIMMLLTGLGVMFGIGGSVVAAIHLAKENRKAARINVTQAFWAAFILSIGICVLLYSCPERILRLLGMTDELMEMSLEYLLWFVPTAVFIMIQLVGEFIIRLDGAPKYAMFAQIIPATLNIILDYVFIFPMGMGLKGAALATDIGTCVGASMTLFYMFRLSNNLTFYRLKATFTSLRLTLRNVGYMANVGFSGFVGELAMLVTTIAGNLAYGKYLGNEGIAAFSVICYIYPVAYNVYYAVISSAQPIISYNYGAAKTGRVDKTFRYGLKVSMICALVTTSVILLFSPYVTSAFLTSGSVTFDLASTGLRWFSLGFPIIAFNIGAIGYFQGTEKNAPATVIMSLRGIFLVVLSFWLLPMLLNEIGLYLAVPVAEFLTVFASVFLLRRSIRRQ